MKCFFKMFAKPRNVYWGCEGLYDKINEHFKDKARKECLWERFANSHKLSVKVYKTWFKSQRTPYGQTQSKSGQAPKEMTERQNWIQDKFNSHQTQGLFSL